ncbi:hypothetical protein DET57_10928 [Klebsiella oxytoca]|uniref:Uncharacterized protein n=1 Tax=Klebsiella oxytoca TaxID=571 RepID=A0A318FMJ6_KLEOX|nr:hypothetical protein DET57_10928 [Klebsiella oxytoca]
MFMDFQVVLRPKIQTSPTCSGEKEAKTFDVSWL